jgi:hypothetical protein
LASFEEARPAGVVAAAPSPNVIRASQPLLKLETVVGCFGDHLFVVHDDKDARSV